MGKSVLEAIQAGDWSYEPTTEYETREFCATNAEPGSSEKLAILAKRIRAGYPLWHPEDRHAEDLPIILSTGFDAVGALG